jgi:hypothetical protein
MATPTGSAQKKARKIIRFAFRPTIYPFPEAIHHHPLDQVIRLLAIGNAGILRLVYLGLLRRNRHCGRPLAGQAPIAS